MLWALYVLFSGSLYLWTVSAVTCKSAASNSQYIGGIALVTLLALLVWKMDRSKKLWKGVIIACVFMNIGLSVAHRFIEKDEDNKYTTNNYVKDMVLMLLVFVVIYAFVRWTRIYKIRLVNLLTTIALPIVIFGARLFGKAVNGAYIYFAGMMIFGVVLLGFPFVAAFFVAQEEKRYRNGNVRNLSWNLMGLLFYTFLLYMGCAICNEFGLLMIIGLTTTMVFLIHCKNGLTKFCYTFACVTGALVAGCTITRLTERIQIWLNPSSAYGVAGMGFKAESVLYLFRHIHQMGWWGNGIGTLPKSIYPTLNTDHIIVTLMNDYSIWMAIAVVVLGVVFCRWMLVQPEGVGIYDSYLNICCGVIIGFVFVINVASNLGSFLTAGIGFPWISDGGTSNIMLTGLMAIHCGLIAKGENAYDES